MFDLHAIHIENFKSFAGSHDFEFPHEDGLYFLTGKNRVEPKLGSNGAGKSTFLDAINWCFTGKTLRGLRSSDIISWGEKGCIVSVDLTVGNSRKIITRTQAPNLLKLGMETVDQPTLEKYLRLNPECITYSLIMPQFGQSFFELTPTVKLNLLSQIMNLQYWLDRSELAAERTKEIEESLATVKANVSGSEGAISTIEEVLNDLADKQDKYAAEKYKTIERFKGFLAATDENLGKVTSQFETNEKALKALSADIDVQIQAVDQVNSRLNKYIEREAELTADRTTVDVRRDNVLVTIKGLMTLEGVCPMCRQKVNAQHLADEKLALKRKAEQYEAELREITQQIGVCKDFRVRISENLKNQKAKLAELSEESQEAKVKRAKLGTELEVKQRARGELYRQLSVERDRPNPYTALITQKRADLKMRVQKLEKAKLRLNELNAQHEATSFWVGGFKKVRLFVMEEAIKTLELEVNNSLTTLGLADWAIEFDVERENKSGTITKGFTVNVINPQHPEAVKWEAWSGGEAQRLQLAGDLGLANMIMTHAGLTSTIEFYDEPSRHLSKEGLLDLAETLYQRAINEHKRIFLVDHNMPDFGDFAMVIQVIKDKHGSSIKYEE